MRPPPRLGGATPAALSCPSQQDELDHLFKSEAPALHRYFRRRTNDNDAAADLVQDAFLSMATRPQDGIANPAAYLQRIARNLLADRFRNRRHSAYDDAIPLEECDVVVPPLQEEISRYRQAIDGLSDKTKAIFLLQRIEGLTYDQISRQVGVSVSTVEYHMMRALAHIDRVLEGL